MTLSTAFKSRQTKLAGRYIPQHALPIEEAGLGIVYVYPAAGKFGAIAYRPKANKRDWHYTFKSDTAVDAYIAKWFDGLRAHQAMIVERREISKKPHTFVVGDIVTNSWGYDQTNVDWYRVTKTTAHFIWLQPIAATLDTGGGVGPMSGHESIALDANLKPIDTKGPVTKHAATGDNCTMRHGCASKWNGREMYSSWYA